MSYGQTISSITPSKGIRNVDSLQISIVGNNTKFAQSSNAVEIFYPGTTYDYLQIDSVNVIDTLHMDVMVSIAADDSLGFYTVRVPDSLAGFIDLISGFEVLQGFVSGQVFVDTNIQNCVLDPNETGLAGVNVQIEPGGYITQTDTNGIWHLDSLPAGSYLANVDTTGYWSMSCSGQIGFTVTNSQDLTVVGDIGAVPKFARGKVFLDSLNVNCNFDVGEAEIQGVQLTILPENKTVWTDNNGYWFADSLNLGAHTIVIDNVSDSIVTCNSSLQFNVGGVYSNIDTLEIGLFPNGLIQGIVFADSSAQNCLMDANEYGLAGIGVAIQPGNIITQTDANGNWYIDSLAAGTYEVFYDTSGYWNGSCSNSQILTVSNSLGYLESSFGMTPRMISGTVYIDDISNCIYDASESGVSGINIMLFPGNLITQTDANGNWSFDSIPSNGSYGIVVDTTGNYFLNCINGVVPLYSGNVMQNDVNIGLNPVICSSPDISISTWAFRRFMTSTISVQACNLLDAQTSMPSAYVDVYLHPAINLTSAQIPYTNLGNGSYRFDVGDLNPGECSNFWIRGYVTSSASWNQTLCVQAELYPVDNCVLDTIPSPPIDLGGVTGFTLPEACTLPWDNSSLLVEGWCQNDSVYFSITNTGDFGNGDMDCYSPVLLYINDTLVMVDSVMIQGQETIYYSFQGNGETYVLHAEQHPLHPGSSHPNAHVEACGNPNNNWIPNMVNNQPQNDADPIIDIFCLPVTGSYDPNDKTGFPNGTTDQNFIHANQQLEYLIRFQNTGNDTAFTVIIRDTLDTDLNIFSVSSGASSHAYSFQMYGPRVLQWTFNNILLPDSTTNEVESHGFVKFTVDQVPNLAEGTEITNEVGIYFDFNAPVITNRTMHRISYFTESAPLEVFEIVSDEGKLITVYPNPNNGLLYIDFEDYNSPAEYTILDLNGRRVLSGKLTQHKNVVDLQNLNSGVYLIQVEESSPVRIIKQ